MKSIWFATLALLFSAPGCGDGEQAAAGGDIGGGGPGGAGGAGGSGGAGGAAACEVPDAPLRLVFTMPDGRVLDSNLAVDQLIEASADLTGPASLPATGGLQVTDDASGDVAHLLAEGTGGIQAFEGQILKMSLRFAPRELGGPDAYQVEVIYPSTDQLLFFAMEGHIRKFDGVRVSVALGDETCSSIDEGSGSVGAGTGAGHRLMEAVVNAGGAASVAIPSGAEASVESPEFPLNVKNQSTAVYVTPPEGYNATAITGHVVFPPD